MNRNVTWILVANKMEAKIYEKRPDQTEMSSLKEFGNPKARATDKDLGTDKPGRSFDMGVGMRHALSQEHGPADTALQEYVRTISHELENGLKQHSFGRLVLIAGPNLLGRLKGELAPQLLSCLIKAIPKNLVSAPLTQVREEIGDAFKLDVASTG